MVFVMIIEILGFYSLFFCDVNKYMYIFYWEWGNYLRCIRNWLLCCNVMIKSLIDIGFLGMWCNIVLFVYMF